MWVTDLSRSTTSRFTFDASRENTSPIWSPDGTRIVYGSFRNGKGGLYQELANNAGTEERLVESNGPTAPMSWSPDGSSVVYEVIDPKTSNDLWVLPLSDDRKPSPLLQTPFAESHGQISPDGKWLAYYTNETGRNEVYVQPFPTGAGKWQVSTNEGWFPRWRRDARELFYMTQQSGGKMMAVDVRSNGSTFEAGSPKELFDSPYVNLQHTGGARRWRLSHVRRLRGRAAFSDSASAVERRRRPDDADRGRGKLGRRTQVGRALSGPASCWANWSSAGRP